VQLPILAFNEDVDAIPRIIYWKRVDSVMCIYITAGTLVPSSVNGDIAIQWEWSNFDPSQNPNP